MTNLEIISLTGELLGKFNHNIDHNYNEFINNIYSNCESILEDTNNTGFCNRFMIDSIEIKYNNYTECNSKFELYNIITYIKTGLPKVFSTDCAFAVLKTDGSVMQWGTDSDLKDYLQSDVKNIYTTKCMFAVLKNDDSIFIFGGGYIKHLSNIKQIYSMRYSFIVFKNDGSIMTYDTYDTYYTHEDCSNIYVGNSRLLNISDSDVKNIQLSVRASALLRNDGSVISWNTLLKEYDDLNILTLYNYDSVNVKNIFPTENTFCSQKINNSLITCIYVSRNNDDSKHFISDVIKIISIELDYQSKVHEYAALKKDGSVITWSYRGENENVSDLDERYIYCPTEHLSSNVKNIYTTYGAFAALKNDGSVITWGHTEYGANSDSVKEQLSSGSNIKKIFTTATSFAALKTDGSVIIWGCINSGLVKQHLQSDVKNIYSTFYAFAALKNDGSVITWGNDRYGDYSGKLHLVKEYLQSDVKHIYSSYYEFVAVKNDGTIIKWGDKEYGIVIL